MNNLQRFNQTLENLDLEVEKLQNTSEIFSKFQDIVAEYKLINQKIEENNKILQEINISHKNISTNIDEKIEKIISKNKTFYQDFESTLRIKLDETKSEVKHLIENERLLIMRIVETELSKVEQNLNKEIIKNSNVIIAKNETNKNILLGVLIIIVALLGFFLYKLL